MYKEKIESYFSDKRDLLTESICRLVRIDSTLGPAQPGMPFGPGPAAALTEALQIAEEFGLKNENLEGYVGVVDLNTSDETALHILGHMDVVDGGDGWTVTTPFDPKEINGLLYGRGTDDDKGPMVAALMAMKAIKDMEIPLTKNVRLILGTDEETGFRDIHWYYDRHPYAPNTFSPDAEFPITNTEKGHFQPTFHKSWDVSNALPRVTAVSAANRVNVVPAAASAQVSGMSPADIRTFADRLNLDHITFRLTATASGTEIHCSGLGSHGSKPEDGHNALTALVSLLASLPLAPLPSTNSIHEIASLLPHGDLYGSALGVEQKDDISGPLTVAFSMLNLNEEGFTARFDIRTPLCGTEENVCNIIHSKMSAAGFHLEGQLDPPHHVPEDSPFIKILAECYEQFTGNKGECLSTGGGTYVHGIPGGVAFGAGMPGFVSNLHGPDERVKLESLMTAARIFTSVIIRLCS